MKLRVALKGGAGSGHFNHSGRPGKVGGSVAYGAIPQGIISEWNELSNLYASITDVGFDSEPLPLQEERKLRDEYDAKSSDFAAHVTSWFDDTLQSSNIPLYRTASFTGIGAEHYEGGIFTALIPNIAQKYADFSGSSVVKLTLPRGSKVWNEISNGKIHTAQDIATVKSQGFVAILRPQYAEVIVLGSAVVEKGGAGSGNFGHAGRPGKVGGSAQSSIDRTAHIEYSNALSAEEKRVVRRYTGGDYTYMNRHMRTGHSTSDSIKQKIHILNNVIEHAPPFTQPIVLHRSTSQDISNWEIGGVIESKGFTSTSLKQSNRGTQTYDRSHYFRISMPIGSKGLFVSTIGGHASEQEVILQPAQYKVTDIQPFNAHASIVDLEWVGALSILKEHTFKGGPGSGNFGHVGRPGKVGGSGSSHYLPPEQRVWQGTRHDIVSTLTKLQTGAIGEYLADKALEDMFGVQFSTLNEGVNNAPIDIAGDHHAVEVKCGPASNGVSAQHWRATIATEGKRERQAVARMSAADKRAYNQLKAQAVLDRKNSMLRSMSDIAGHDIQPATIGVILSPDGTRGDVFFIPGFHLRIGWNVGATEEYYVGTYTVDDVSAFKEYIPHITIDTDIVNDEIASLLRDGAVELRTAYMNAMQMEKLLIRYDWYRNNEHDMERITSIIDRKRLPPPILAGVEDNWWVVAGMHRLSILAAQGVEQFPAYFLTGVRNLKGGPGSGHYGHEGRPGKIGGSAPGNNITFNTKPTEYELENAWDETKNWEPSRKTIARAALDDMMGRRTNYSGFMMRDDVGLSAVLSYIDNGDVVLVNNFATRQSGGLDILQQFRQMADKPLEFHATVSARDYYEHIGLVLTEGTTNVYQYKGGPGSGHFGHSGRPGKVGGSATGKIIGSPQNAISQEDFKRDNAQTTESLMEVVGADLAHDWSVEPDVLFRMAQETYSRDTIFDVSNIEQAREQYVTSLLHQWGGSSGSPETIAMVDGVAKKLGLSYDPYNEVNHNNLFAYLDKSMPGSRQAYAELGVIMYNNTQQWFAERGIKELTLIRSGESNANRLYSSWTLDWGGVRHDSGRNVIREVIPIEYILSTPATGFGTLAESEIVVLPRPSVLKGGPGSGNFSHAGRPGKVGGSAPSSVTFYHGTSSTYAESILKNGLIPGKSIGSDSWAHKNGWGGAVSKAFVEGNQVNVYMTPDINLALLYAKRVSMHVVAEPLVLKVMIPSNVKGLKLDPMDDKGIMYTGSIPPDWLSVIDIESKEVDDTILYVVVHDEPSIEVLSGTNNDE